MKTGSGDLDNASKSGRTDAGTGWETPNRTTTSRRNEPCGDAGTPDRWLAGLRPRLTPDFQPGKALPDVGRRGLE
jgi:hypothetical protein